MAYRPVKTPAMDFLEDGWVQVVDLPGWEGFGVDLRADLVNGEPRITGLRLEPRPGSPKRDAVLTANRLKTFPMAALAASVYFATHLPLSGPSALVQALIESGEALAAQPRRKGGGRVTTPEQVAAVYKEALLSPVARYRVAPRDAVCKALNISSRTADRYLSKARRGGLLPPYDSREEQE